MSNVLRVRTEPGGEWTEIPSIQGPQGEDGFSPVVTTTPIDGGTKVTITDATGPHEFNVMDGAGGNVDNELITIKDTVVTNASQLPEKSCCVHAINSEIGFSFNDDIIYIANLESQRVIYTINGDMITLIADSTGNLSVDSSGIERWAKESDVYNKEQVDEKIAAVAPDLSGYALKTEIPDVSQFKTGTEIQTMIDASIAAITDFTEVSF